MPGIKERSSISAPNFLILKEKCIASAALVWILN